MKLTEEDFNEHNHEKQQNPSLSTDDKEENLYSENSLELAGLSFKEKLAYKKELNQKRLATMNKGEKRKYILRYYKWHFIGCILGIICIFLLGHTIYRATLPEALSIAITHENGDSDALTYLPDAFREYYHLEEKEIINVITNLRIVNSLEDSTSTTDELDASSNRTLSDNRQLMIYVNADTLDAIIGDETTLDYCASSGDLNMVQNCLSDDLYKKFEDYMVITTDETGYLNGGKPCATAIDISNTDFAKNCNLPYDQVYFMFPNSCSENNEKTIRLLNFIFETE